jgi:uncharacterized protein YjcR
MSLDPKAYEAANKGRVASILISNLSPYMETMRKRLISDLMSHYREGKMDAVFCFSRIAALCSMDDLENMLSSAVHKGEKVTGEYNNV